MNAVFTMWQNDLVALDLWLKYYSKYFDRMLVLLNGTKGEYHAFLDERKKEYMMDYIVLPEFVGDAGVARGVVDKYQRELLKSNKWVLYTNCDEIIATKPSVYKNLKYLMYICKQEWVACEGYEIVQTEGDAPLDYSKPIMPQRKHWIKNFNMNKIVLSRIPLEWNEGQHQITGIVNEDSKSIADTGLYLIHLKHADLTPIQPRDFGPMTTSTNDYVMTQIKEALLEIPDWVNDLI
jgi:hypothetical protein